MGQRAVAADHSTHQPSAQTCLRCTACSVFAFRCHCDFHIYFGASPRLAVDAGYDFFFLKRILRMSCFPSLASRLAPAQRYRFRARREKNNNSVLTERKTLDLRQVCFFFCCLFFCFFFVCASLLSFK